jgi:hypothetical protein
VLHTPKAEHHGLVSLHPLALGPAPPGAAHRQGPRAAGSYALPRAARAKSERRRELCTTKGRTRQGQTLPGIELLALKLLEAAG